MKKVSMILALSMLAGAIFTLPGVAPRAAASSPVIDLDHNDIQVLVDARKVKFPGAAAYETGGRVMVPFRGIGEAIKAKIGFTGNTVTFSGDKREITLTIGSKTALVDGKPVSMDTAAVAKNGRTYVPLRFLSENLGKAIEWDPASHWVWVGSKKVPTPEEAGIKPVSIDAYKKMIGTAYSGIYEGKTNAYVFSEDQLPLKVGSQVLYDVWKIKQGDDTGIRVRFTISGGYPPVYYLTEGKAGARLRYNVQGMLEKFQDGSAATAYQISSRRDEDMIGDSKYGNFTLDKADYLGFIASTGESLALLKNPLK